MIFNEALYPLFLVVAVAVFFWVPVSWRAGWLFVSGLVFYGYYADFFLLLFALEALAVFWLMKHYRERRQVFVLAVVLCTLILGYYKYRNMAILSWHQLSCGFGCQDLPQLEYLLLPLAISFFTFEFIHYLADAHQGKIERHSLIEFMAFIMFFPTMIAGPIKRFQGFVPQIQNARFAWGHLQAGSTRILIGSAKKIMVADSMDLWIQPLLSQQSVSQSSPGVLAVALLAYSLKIYLDFSGYSDIAIGSARLFGIEVPENFNWPYLRANIALFWRNWHISLTQWITDYVFIPLGGSRAGHWLTVRNLLIAMAVSGIWHGAAWHFVFWGLYHGLLLAIQRTYREYIKPHLPWLERWPRTYQASMTLLTFVLVTIGWGLFIMPLPRFGLLLQRLVGL